MHMTPVQIATKGTLEKSSSAWLVAAARCSVARCFASWLSQPLLAI